MVSDEEANCRRMTLESVRKATGKFKVLVQWLLDEYETREAMIAKIEEMQNCKYNWGQDNTTYNAGVQWGLAHILAFIRNPKEAADG